MWDVKLSSTRLMRHLAPFAQRCTRSVFVTHSGGLAACGQDAISIDRQENNDAAVLRAVGMEDPIDTPRNDGSGNNSPRGLRREEEGEKGFSFS